MRLTVHLYVESIKY